MILFLAGFLIGIIFGALIVYVIYKDDYKLPYNTEDFIPIRTNKKWN
jgi:hypothetical protein